MPEVVILSLAEESGSGCGEACGCGGADKPQTTRVPALTCADVLRQAGAAVEMVTACSDAEIDAAVKAAETGDARLIVAAATDGEVRAVIRRMVRHHAPPPSKRPADLPAGRTVYDLPPIAVLPLHPSVPELVDRLSLPRPPQEVALAVLAGRTKRFDLLRNDAGSVTLNGSLLGGVNASGSVGVWRGRVEVDDAVLSDGEESLVACAIGNAGPAELDGLPLLIGPSAEDGVVEVAVALPLVRNRLLRRPEVRFEVRRARGRAVSVTPRDGADLHLVDDGVAGVLTRKRAWWTEPGAWAAYLI